MILTAIRKRQPWIKHLFADRAYDRGKLMDKAAYLDFVIEVVRRIEGQPGFMIHVAMGGLLLRRINH